MIGLDARRFNVTTATDVRRIPALDSIRGIAAVVVVVHHCLLTQPAFSNYFFSIWQTAPSTTGEWLLFNTPLRLVWSGAESVILFYVLSGMVLALPWVAGSPPRYLPYVIKRFFRLYLPYMASIIAAASLALLLHDRAVVPGFSDWVNMMNWTKPVTSAVLVDHAIMLGHQNSVNGVIHTLIWEMRASLALPFLIVPIVRYRTLGAIAVLALIAAVVLGIHYRYAPDTSPFVLIEWRPGFDKLAQIALEVQWSAYYCTFFVIGGWLAIQAGRLQRLPRRSTYMILVTGLLVIQGHWSHLPMAQELAVSLGAAMIIIAPMPVGPIKRALEHKWLRWLGRMSFSLYLVHVPLLLAFVILLRGAATLPVILAVIPAASLLVAWMFNAVITEPSATLGKQIARSRKLPIRLFAALRSSQ